MRTNYERDISSLSEIDDLAKRWAISDKDVPG
jgi:hypothetical protein